MGQLLAEEATLQLEITQNTSAFRPHYSRSLSHNLQTLQLWTERQIIFGEQYWFKFTDKGVQLQFLPFSKLKTALKAKTIILLCNVNEVENVYHCVPIYYILWAWTLTWFKWWDLFRIGFKTIWRVKVRYLLTERTKDHFNVNKIYCKNRGSNNYLYYCLVCHKAVVFIIF